MRAIFGLFSCFLLCSHMLIAASKQHVVSFGKWTIVKLLVQDDEHDAVTLRVRPLLVDGRIKEFTLGSVHDVTDRTFVVQRIYRINDSLPQEPGAIQWRWESGSWMLVNRVSGKVQPIALPMFDADSSEVSWFRDYAAYCGLSDDGKKTFAVVVQLGRRRPLLKKPLGGDGSGEATGSQCSIPTWERSPTRATFAPGGDQKFTFGVSSRTVDLVSSDEDEDDE